MIPDLPPSPIPYDRPLILASGSPRRRDLLAKAGYEFTVEPPDDAAECGICSREQTYEMVARLAMQKAADVAKRVGPSLVLAADTLADCKGQILGKPANRTHAERMMRLLSGQLHTVYTGVCLWLLPERRVLVDVSVTTLKMRPISELELEKHLDSDRWCGKAAAFGFQDDNDWLRVLKGSESNVVGLPLERLAELLLRFDELAI